MSKNYIDKYSIIYKNKRKFELLLKKIENEDNLGRKVNLAKKAIKFAINNGTGYYSSNVIENVFLEIARKYSIDSDENKPFANSFLHVMSETLETGGHTRVVERWISNSPPNQKHSLVTTWNNAQQIPQKLCTNIIEKEGMIYKLQDEMGDIEKGLELRKIAMQYEYIILHVHMNDIIPLIAFGTEEFTRPIIFFNHADHLFWVGISIADIVADLKNNGSKLTTSRRMAQRSFILGVPIDYKLEKNNNRNEAKKSLGIPMNQKVILTVGSSLKYNPILDLSYINIALKILKIDNKIVCYAIGPSSKETYWKKAEKISNGRIRTLGSVSHDKLNDYYKASDIVVDSIPLGGGTACIDAISCGSPVLTLNNPFGQFDYLVESDAYCETENELLIKIKEMMSDEKVIENNIRSIKEKLLEGHSRSIWEKNVKKLIDEMPISHTVYAFENDVKDSMIEENDLWITLVYSITFRKNLIKLAQMLENGDLIEIGHSIERKISRCLGKK